LSTKTEQLEWRRSKVVEMRARGFSYGEIARELQVLKTSIGTDVQYLCQQAKESIKEYATEYLLEQYRVCLCALDTILKHAFDIIETSDDNREKLQAMELELLSNALETSDDNREKLQAMELELLSNATTIDSALTNRLTSELAIDDDNNDNEDQPNTTGGRQTVF
jgi:transcriptional regulator